MPKRVYLEQRTPEWYAWRKMGIGSSDVDVIMGSNPYKTREELFREKTGQSKKQAENSRMATGRQLEPAARAHYEILHDTDFEDACFVHDKYEFMKVSLDGWREPTKSVLEIKSGKSAHKYAKNGQVPPYYIGQCQYQLFVTEAHELIYWSFDIEKVVGNGTHWAHRMEPNLNYHKEMVEKICQFHFEVQKFINNKESVNV